MKSVDEAVILAKTMVEIGKALGRRTVAVVTDMSQPLGYEVGNANEVKEAIEILKGHGAEDETTVALTIASHMAVLGGAFSDYESAYNHMRKLIESRQGSGKIKGIIRIQGEIPMWWTTQIFYPRPKTHRS